jgi:N-acetylmuramoyl-L-alanine amidase
MKISIDAGHNCTPDVGASGIRQEDNLTKEVVGLVVPKLRALGHAVIDCTPYGQTFSNVGAALAYRCAIANQNQTELHLCIHFNAGGGEGTEVYAVSSKGKEFAQKILSAICSLGYINRGVKDGSHLYVVNQTDMPCCLVECSFVDNTNDMSKYNADSLANAIVKAVTGQDVVAPVLTTQSQINYNYAYLQHEIGTSEDNIPGPITLSKCPLVKQGSTGNIVKWIQAKLGIAIDGIFGRQTLIAIQNFQAKNGLVADGIVGQNTWRKLLGL